MLGLLSLMRCDHRSIDGFCHQESGMTLYLCLRSPLAVGLSNGCLEELSLDGLRSGHNRYGILMSDPWG